VGASRWLVVLVLVACGPEPEDDASASRAQQASTQAPETGCQQVRGTFTDVFLSGDACAPTSPILLCTRGQLEGDLSPAYDFFFTSQAPTHDHGPAVRSHFAGKSHLTFSDGTLFSEDHGGITIKQKGDSPFLTQIDIVSGTGAYAQVTGHLTAIGKADFSTGLGGGTYHGTLCGLPEATVASALRLPEQVLGATPQ